MPSVQMIAIVLQPIQIEVWAILSKGGHHLVLFLMVAKLSCSQGRWQIYVAGWEGHCKEQVNMGREEGTV